MPFKMKYLVEAKYLPTGSKRRSGTPLKVVKFITSHDTGNDGSTAEGNVKYYTRSCNDASASAHTFIDHRRIIECIPATTGVPEKAWHVVYDTVADNALYGDDANDVAIGVELCYSRERGAVDNAEAYRRYVWYHAYLCYKFNLDPLRHIVGHNELDPSRKTDPFKNALAVMHISKPEFLQDVVNELNDCLGRVKPVIESEGGGTMKLTPWQKSLLVEGVQKYNDVTGANGEPVVGDPSLWLAKINAGTLTVDELSILTFAIVSRAVK